MNRLIAILLLVTSSVTLRAADTLSTLAKTNILGTNDLFLLSVKVGSGYVSRTITESNIFRYVKGVADSSAAAAVAGGITATNVSSTNIIGRSNVWVLTEWGSAADADAAVNSLATLMHGSGSGKGGTLYFPRGTFTADATMVFNNGAGAGMPAAQFDYGNFTITGDKLAKINWANNTNCFLITGSNWRKLTFNYLNIAGTNSPRGTNVLHVGLALAGPSGIGTVEDVNFQALGVALLLNDVTSFEVNRGVYASNYIGIATCYKPDGVAIRGVRADRNNYGVWLHFTNAQFTTLANSGDPSIGGTFGNNLKAAIVIPRHSATITHSYFEDNGASLQLGLNSSDPYEGSYDTTAGNAPVVTVQPGAFNANGANDVKIYRSSTLRFLGGQTYAGSAVRLLNAAADGSTIESDDSIVVYKSDASTVTIGNGYRYVAGVRVPISAASWTNLTDVPAGFADNTDDGGTGAAFWETNAVLGGIKYTNRTEVRHPWAVAYWSLDEASGTRFDSVGTNNLTAIGSATGSVVRVSWGATNYHDPTAWLYAADSPQLTLASNWTVGGWFQGYSQATVPTDLITKSNEWRLYYTGATANRYRFAFGDADLNYAVSGTAGLTTNRFYLVWWDGATLSMQIGDAGVMADVYTTNLNTSGATITPPTDTSSLLSVLRSTDSTMIAAADEVFIADRVLTAAERTNLFNVNAGRALTVPNLVATEATIKRLRVTEGVVGDLSISGTLVVSNIVVSTNRNPHTDYIDFTSGGYTVIRTNADWAINACYGVATGSSDTNLQDAMLTWTNLAGSANVKTLTLHASFQNMNPSQGNTLYCTNLGKLYVQRSLYEGTNFWWISR